MTFDQLLKQSETQPTLALLVRHRGCTFCRETLSNLKKVEKKLREAGYSILVIHMGDEVSSGLMQEEFELPEVQFIADPHKKLYAALGARRGKFLEVLGPDVIKRGVFSGALFKHGVGRLEGDGFQLGGLYKLINGKVTCLHRPKTAADVENWPELVKMVVA